MIDRHAGLSLDTLTFPITAIRLGRLIDTIEMVVIPHTIFSNIPLSTQNGFVCELSFSLQHQPSEAFGFVHIL